MQKEREDFIMKNDSNTVVLETKEEKAKRKILKVIEECTELTILLPEEPLRMIVSLDNDIMINIIKMLILEGLFHAVTIQPYSKVKDQQVASETTQKQQSVETSTQEPMKENTKEDTSKPSAEVSKEVSTQPAMKKTNKRQTTKDRALLFMQQEARVLSNAEIYAAVGSNISPSDLSHNLTLLCKQGKIEKVARGYWKVKGVEGEAPTATKESKQEKDTSTEKPRKEEVKPEKTTQDEIIEQGGKETKEQATKQENSQITEQQVLNLFTTTGWQMTQEEVAKKLNAKPEVVVKVLNILVGNKKLQKEGEVYKIHKSPFGIFEDKTYRVLLDYIMEQNHFVEAVIKNKFPQEAHKLEELLKQMGQKYIKEEQNAKGSYNVYLKGRILYYVMKHPNTDLGDIRHAFPTISNQEISNAINIALRNKELKRDAKTGTFVTVSM